VTCHYHGGKGHIVLDCNNKAQNHANEVLKSQANVVAQGSSTSTSAYSTQTLQYFLWQLLQKKKIVQILGI
jgi:hypothetical protein